MLIALETLTVAERDWIAAAAAIADMSNAQFITERLQRAIADDMAAAKNGRMTIPKQDGET